MRQAGGRPESDATQRNLGPDRLGGVIFGCETRTYDECMHGLVFGLPPAHFSYVQHVRPGMPVFLFHYHKRELYGIFRSVSHGSLNINPHGWTQMPGQRTRYPAQVAVEMYKYCPALSEREFRPVIAHCYSPNSHKFKFELLTDEAAELCRLLARKAEGLPLDPGPASGPAMPLPAPAAPRQPAGARGGGGGRQPAQPELLPALPARPASRPHLPSGVPLAAQSAGEAQPGPTAASSSAAPAAGRPATHAGPLPATSAASPVANGAPRALGANGHVALPPGRSLAPAAPMTERPPGPAAALEDALLSLSLQERAQPAPPLAAQAKGGSQDAIWLLGGSIGTSFLDTVYTFNPTTRACTRVATMPYPCGYHAALPLGRRLYMLGGGDGARWLDSVATFDLDIRQWQQVAPMAAQRGCHAAAELGGRLYVLGGSHPTAQLRGLDCHDTTEVYYPEVDRWAAAPRLTSSRHSAAVATAHGALWLAGGYDGAARRYLAALERLDPRQPAWQQVGSMAERRGGHAAVVLGESLYCAGGWAGTSKADYSNLAPLTSVERYDLRTGRWDAAPPLHTPRVFGAFAAAGGALHALGGITNGLGYAAACERFDEAAGAWQVLPVAGDAAGCERALMASCLAPQLA